MKRYGKNYILTPKFMSEIASYMDDGKRETVHFELAPCEPEKFLKRYSELDPDFVEFLNNEFGIEM
ncbi:MAG: hypothetical protein NC548_30285 [Lachnospiraceae bacterium]|nr:hypothetical protein [Lachnospiraceae bacterium]